MSTTLISAQTASRLEEKYGSDFLYEVARQLSAIKRGEETPMGFREALTMAKRTMAENNSVSGIKMICRRADNDQIWLVHFGSRGGWRRVAILTNSDGSAYGA